MEMAYCRTPVVLLTLRVASVLQGGQSWKEIPHRYDTGSKHLCFQSRWARLLSLIRSCAEDEVLGSRRRGACHARWRGGRDSEEFQFTRLIHSQTCFS